MIGLIKKHYFCSILQNVLNGIVFCYKMLLIYIVYGVSLSELRSLNLAGRIVGHGENMDIFSRKFFLYVVRVIKWSIGHCDHKDLPLTTNRSRIPYQAHEMTSGIALSCH